MRAAAPLLIACLPTVALAQDPPVGAWKLVHQGTIDALKGSGPSAIDKLERAATIAPEFPGVQEALGATALFLGDITRARRVLGRLPNMSLYLAMAESEGPGGLARADTVLSAETKRPDKEADPGALFLAALAFQAAGQSDRANELLKRALGKVPSVLDDSLSPDPASAMVRAVLLSLDAAKVPEATHALVPLAAVLVEEKRRSLAVMVADRCLKSADTRPGGLRVLVLVENETEARHALGRVEQLLRDEPDAEDAKVARVILLFRSGQLERAKRALEQIGGLTEKDLASEIEEVRAEISLGSPAPGAKDGARRPRARPVSTGADPAVALEAAEAAVRAYPSSDTAVFVMVRALIAAGKLDRAEAFAGALLKRKPKAVDPYALMEEIAEAKGQVRQASEMHLRSQAFSKEKGKLDHAVKEREEIFRAVRDAEGGVGVVGFEALRAEHLALSLPIDFALAKSGSPGFARAARDRILAACTPKLRAMLTNRRGSDFVTISFSPYGVVETVEAPLSAADPGRCGR
jgi:tetratricopeptide (TPR) repeat protein